MPHQWDYVRSDAKFLIGSGGVGSGKSWSLIYRTIRLAVENPGIKILITDNAWPSLRDTTYSDFFVVCPPELIMGHNRTTHLVSLVNGSTILFRAFDNANKVKRYTFGAIGGEEITDLPEEIFKTLRTRLRQPGMPNCFYGVTNPSTYQNWVYRYFINPDSLQKISGSEVVFSITRDNSFLDDEYVNDMESVKEIDESYYRRMINGEWGTLEGLIYELPAEQRNLPHRPNGYDLFLLGVDFGYTHPTAMVVIGVVTNRGKLEFDIVEEVYQTGMTSQMIVDEVQSLHDKYDFFDVFPDPARPEIMQDMDDSGLPVRWWTKQPGSVFSGVLKLKSLINQGRLNVHADCEKTLEEFDAYRWALGLSGAKREEPRDEYNHALDAIRYAIVTYLKEDAGDGSLEDILRAQKQL